jgi:hypothetical protein
VIWVIVAEAIAIVILGLFVVALAHSYAGLAGRLETSGRSMPEPIKAGRVGVTPGSRSAAAPATHLVGTTLSGDEVAIPLVGAADDTLLAFLSSSCASCQHLWQTLDDDGVALPVGTRLVVVPKGPERESPSAIAALAPSGAEVVLSTGAWSDFEVPGSPYFALVAGATGAVVGEGTALTWPRVLDLMGTSTADAARSGAPRKPARDRRQEADVDRVLLEAGILPGDPSLYPGAAAGA